MSRPNRLRRAVAALRSLTIVAMVAAGVPVVLVWAARVLGGSANPLAGVPSPHRWRLSDLGGRADEDTLVSVLGRSAIVATWACLALVVAMTVAELRSVRRHGWSLPPIRGLGWSQAVARRLVAGLLAVMPVSGPTTALALPVRVPVAMAEHRTVDDVSPTARPATATEPALWHVRPGESVASIAAELAGGSSTRAAELANRIVDHNLGRVMADGRRFTTAAYLESGWTLELPPAPTGHLVRPGDSYWRIADGHLDAVLGRPATAREVLELTEDLIELNADRLGHREPTMLRPGELVLLLPPAQPTVGVASEVEPAAEEETDRAADERARPDETQPPTDPASTLPAPPDSSPVTVPPHSPPQAGRPQREPAPSAARSVAHASEAPAYIAFGVGASAMLTAAALALLEARRRSSLRSAAVGARIPTPGPSVAATEVALRSLDRREVIARVDLAVRAAAHELAHQERHLVAVVARPNGAIEVVTDEPAALPDDMWEPTLRGWQVPSSVPLERLAEHARQGGSAHPALVELGTVADGMLFVDLEALGLLALDGPPEATRAIAHTIAASVAISPLGARAHLVTTGFVPNGARPASSSTETAVDLDAALDAAAVALGSIGAAASDGTTTFAIRSRASGEAWEPAIVVSVGHDVDGRTAAELRHLTAIPGRGLAVVVDRPIVGCRSSLRADGSTWRLDPLGFDVTPVGLEDADLARLDLLLDQPHVEPATEHTDGSAEESTTEPWSEPRWSLMVRVLGPVEVVGSSGVSLPFERSKAVELVAWLSQHRDRPLRRAARAALWDVEVRDATFANVVSDARRAMARSVTPPAGEEWVGRTLTEHLPLHPLVVTDAELLASRLAWATTAADDHAAIAVLRDGLELVRDMPFAGSGYLWPDAEGITSALIVLVTAAAAAMAQRCLEIGDVDSVFWATGQGLKALPGHEELIAIRMRAHARAGDLAAVRQEWAAYERVLHADAWSDAEPSPKLVAIRRELLSADR